MIEISGDGGGQDSRGRDGGALIHIQGRITEPVGTGYDPYLNVIADIDILIKASGRLRFCLHVHRAGAVSQVFSYDQLLTGPTNYVLFVSM